MTQELQDSKIDYEKEVRKVYPNAAIYDVCGSWLEIRSNSLGRSQSVHISGDASFELDAWRSAYNNLKQQGKI